MKVEVTVEVSALPLKVDIENLRAAAAQLTNRQDSITVQTLPKGEHYALRTRFTMRTAAQYKVVDEIDREFKFWTGELQGYQDMTISFPD